MKKLIFILPLLFLGMQSKAQFNTASYENKASSIEIDRFSDNHFQGTFLTYHIEGASNKKRLKEEKKRAKEKAKEQENSEAMAEPTGTEIPDGQTHSFDKKVVYKRLDPLDKDDFLYEEKQLVYMPLNRMKVTSKFGNRFHPIDREVKFHNGVDLKATDSLVYSVLDGIVLDAGYTPEAGNYIKVLHRGNFETAYLHLAKIYYKKDDPVYAGDIIATSGNTGKSTAPHLHFAVKENGQYIDPIQFLNDLIQTNNALADYEQ